MNVPSQSPIASSAHGPAQAAAPRAFVENFTCTLPDSQADAQPGSASAADTQALSVIQACYRIRRLCWSITGTARIGAGEPVIIRRALRMADGTVRIGSIIGMAAVQASGKWEFLQAGSEEMPDGATYVQISAAPGVDRIAPLTIIL